MYVPYGRMLCVYCMLVTVVVFVKKSLARASGQPARDWCQDTTGQRRSLYEKWVHNRQICECIYPESLSFAWDLTNPSDATPHCQLNGCRNSLTGEYLSSGQSFTRRGSVCTCAEGPDPDLMDYVTAFHLSCVAQTISNDILEASPSSDLVLDNR